mmetsp:Transcript_8391/g.9580  ORF Transcript_8391/g.9580 Transcript_8391/m.9580 type:complete len:201 (-) Transcript_8391:393-995(-)|eukprot:CAMPEP_0184019306 /NCGR_PEP_ID=MMETSP0954-20121128/8674_1 /TAXON_ID=627963 /ORGANISM="Aplanochytrium sp, Strain PBS07" /LENGTH=200 /DNA_ID=CAMNT_0026300949 /DNA_START=208 /DNA_END=810 /DNA_ORIENTATION=-
MDITFGLACNNFVAVVSDMTAARSIMALKHDEEKIIQIDDKKLLACGGDQSSRVQFAEFIQKNMALNKLRNGLEMSNHATANFIRGEIARALRSRGAYQANCLLASVTDAEGPELYYLDYLGSLAKVKYTAHGYGSYFILSMLDAKYSPDLTPEQAIEVIKECIGGIGDRMIFTTKKFKISIIHLDDSSISEHIYVPSQS